ncbi:unnamed protein product [Lupinus luteus]|uniref:Beta-glucosidase n=1 Tax=Lupinus luteus TaxID=3873 RepID=A0AAV1WY36_LUPLU
MALKKRNAIINLILPLIVLFQIQTCKSDINREDFPKGFTFGTASSAFQVEGAVREDGRGPSIWDTFSHTFGKIADFSNADVAVDHYHRIEEDIQIMKDLGVDAYRFSISWSRIFPRIEPYVTIYHWDLPQALHDKYLGWLSDKIINDFANYAETLFQKFGDRVKQWITFNEPQAFTIQGYDTALHAPGRCSILRLCKAGNSSTEPYIVAHNVLRSHATVADIYKRKYKKVQGGSLGVAFNVIWYENATNSQKDIDAAQRAQDFQLGWFLDPLMFGDYPSSMRTRVGDRLPKFSEAESALLKGSLDFVGINHYTTFYARDNYTNFLGIILHDAVSDSGTITLPFKGLKSIGERANSIWLYIVPQGMRSLMNYINKKYGNPPVVITENGMDDPNGPFTSIRDAVKDEKRIRYLNGYLSALRDSIKDGCNVKGYFVWSILDNWEWSAGYSSRFGLYYVDYKNKLKRYPKDSVEWFKKFLKAKK